MVDPVDRDCTRLVDLGLPRYFLLSNRNLVLIKLGLGVAHAFLSLLDSLLYVA